MAKKGMKRPDPMENQPSQYRKKNKKGGEQVVETKK